MNNKDAVNLDHVTRRHRRDDFEVHALDDATIQVPAPTFVAIMGPSGSGKTTTLNLIAGIDHPTTGHVSVGNLEITGMDEKEWRIFSKRHLCPQKRPRVLIPARAVIRKRVLRLDTQEWSGQARFHSQRSGNRG